MKKRFAYLLVIVLVLAVVLGYCTSCSDKKADESPNVLLLTIDALRADRLGCYGYRLDTSPNIDRLAKRGVLFTDCSPQWPKTWPSIAALNTGAYPKTTGMRIERQVLPQSLYTMSEIFSQAGYRTAAVVANFNIGRTFGFDRGFDYFVESWQEKWNVKAGDSPFYNRAGKVKRFTNATIMVDQALKWLRKSKNKRPFFLWLHYMDPHGPYIPPPSYKDYFKGQYKPEPAPLKKLPPYQLQKRSKTSKVITNIGFYRAQYDREIRYLDDELARLFAELKKLDSGRNTVIVFTADHGESFGEHDYYLEHGWFPYQACAHIPLIIVKNDALPAEKTIEQPVGLIDVSATILELAGIDVPATFEGQSLVGLMLDEPNAAAPEHVFMESGYESDKTQLTVRHGRWKLVHVRSPNDRLAMAGTEYELYDVKNDHAELQNLVEEHPELVAHLSEVLHEWYTTGPKPQEQGQKVDMESLDQKAIEMLKSLGYVD